MLFDVEGDPLELRNLADRPEYVAKRESILAAMMARWDEADLEERMRVSQCKRLFVQDAMKFGRFPSWDFDPPDHAAGGDGPEIEPSFVDAARFARNF